jgi:spore maturation protein CgeB
MEFLAKNLKILRQIDRDLASRIEAARVGLPAELGPAKSGVLTARVRGFALHSGYDPIKEAGLQVRRFLDEETGSGPIVVLGLGLGYHLEELFKAARRCSVILVEPDPELFRFALENRDMGEILSKCQRFFVGRPLEEVLAQFDDAAVPLCDCRVLAHPSITRMSPDYCKGFKDRVDTRRILRDLRLKILIISPVYGGSMPIARYCAGALKKLGHQVAMIDNSCYHGLFKEIEGVTSNEFHQRQLQGSLTQHLSEIVMAKCLEFKPDLIFALAQAPLTPDILDRMRSFDLLSAFWFVEDFRELPYWREVAGKYDHFFAIQNRQIFTESESLEGIDFHYLPLACDPTVHRLLKMSDRDRKRFGAAVSFVGAGYYNRQVLFEGLLDFDFKIWGTEWGFGSPLARVIQEGGRRVTTRESVKIFNGSAININLHSSTYHKGINPNGDFVNPRTFEIAAAGGFQLVDPRSHLADLFEIGRDLVSFDDLEDLREKIAYYIANSAEREEIAKHGQKRTRRYHNYERRMIGMLDCVVERNLSRFMALRKSVQTTKRMIEEAGPETELGRFLGGFKGRDRLTLDTITEEIHQGKGRLTEPEVIFLLMHEFCKEKSRILKQLGNET